MSSVGQVAGGIIGGAIGFMAGGNVMLGVSIGASIGGYIDPPKGANTVGPRLEDLTVQTSTYGAVLPRIKGTVAVTGNVFWLEWDRIKEHTKTEKVGGKGGPTSKQTTFSYSATFAVGLSHQISAPVSGIRRLWLANTLVYDAGSGDLNSIIASNQQAGVMFRFYDGRDDQSPDPRMQADKGAANVSGYPGRCYIVFYDLDLTEKYNNTLMAVQAKVELVCDGSPSPAHYPAFTTPYVGYLTNNGFTSKVVSSHISDNKITYAVSLLDAPENLYGFEYYEARFGEYVKKVSSVELDVHASFGHTEPAFILIQDNRDGVVPVVVSQGLYLSYETVFWFISNGSISQSRAYSDAEVDYGYYTIGACDSGYTFMADTDTAKPIIGFRSTDIYATSSVPIHASAIALSDSHVFVSHYTAGTSSVTVSVLDRADLALVSTYTQSVNGSGRVAFHIISDAEFYLGAGQSLSHWISGVATDLGAVLSAPTGTYPFRQIQVSREPDFYIQFDGSSGNYELAGVLTSSTISAQPAKLRDIVTEECALAGISSSDLDLTELIDSDVRGYRVSQAGSVRAVLEQLQAAFPFDVIQSGYKLKFKSRGGASVLTVPESDLGAHTGNDVPSRFMLTTEMPSQVPAKVTFNFLNADREYDPDEQSAAFTAQDVKNSYTVSLPLVMTPTEALQAADVLLKKEQRERTSAGTFWLPPADNYRRLEAADVISVIAQGRTHTLRLVKVTQLPDGRVECDGKLTESAAYASTAQAQNSLALGQATVPLAGSTEMLLLDIPRIVSDQDAFGVSVAMYGYTDGWPGGVAFRSDDSGETYNSLTALNVKAEAFIAGSPLTAASGYAVDSSSILTVTPAWDGADLYSITETQLYAHGNMAAYGADGRWEIVCFKTVSSSSGSYILQDFLRGLYGTEWASGLHADGDLLIMLDVGAADYVSMPISALNSARLWRGVTAGALLESSPAITHTCAGVSLKPLSPVDVRADRDYASRDWTIAASRRTRWPVALFSGLAQPLGESSESYEVEFWSSGFSALKRTVTGLSSPSCVYTSANQIADFGSTQNTISGRFRQVSSVVGRGLPKDFTFTQMMDDDPYFSSVVLGLHMEGSNGSTTFTDIKGNSITAVGNAQLSTGSPQFAFGASCGLFDGTGDYLSFPASSILNFGSGLFTVDGFIRPGAIGAMQLLLDGRGTTAAVACSFLIDIKADGKLEALASATNAGSSGIWDVVLTSSGALVAGTAYHVEICRDAGNVWRMFLDGVQVATTTVNITVGLPATTGYIGTGVSSPGVLGYAFNGRMKDLRISKGVCRHSSNFTPPTTPFPDS